MMFRRLRKAVVGFMHLFSSTTTQQKLRWRRKPYVEQSDYPTRHELRKAGENAMRSMRTNRSDSHLGKGDTHRCVTELSVRRANESMIHGFPVSPRTRRRY